jgi:deferrochelatase/peroxidase EfeB
MDDAFLVRRFERAGNLLRDFERFVQRQRPRERFAFHQLHHQVIRADVIELADVGMIQRGHRARFAFKALGELRRAQASLDSFPPEFQQGMAARAGILGDTGEGSPENWGKPLGSADVHVVLTALAPDTERLEAALTRARQEYQISGITGIWRQHCHALPNQREAFGYRDWISHPAVEGSGIPGSNPHERPLKAGEFVLGYIDEMGDVPVIPKPEILGRNGSYVVFRKLHQRVAAFRQYLRANSSGSTNEELLAAKMMGRWRSGAPLALCPLHDDPELGADQPTSKQCLPL